ncbi:MAG: flippase-like domain-containing protein [Candidatus Omnitrophica bacterium]|nr:flippase-like domain-containing protein [Candidatus Omnitrophota bacterium]
MNKIVIKAIILLIITVVIFVVLFRNIPFVEVATAIEKADFRVILLVLFVSILNGLLISSFRWKLILDKMGLNLSLKELLFIKLGSEPVISVMPFKVGEISRVLYLNRRKDMPADKIAFSIFAEYLLNLLTLFFFIFLGAIYWIFQKVNLNLKDNLFIFSLIVKVPSFKNKLIDKLKKYFQILCRNKEVFLDKKILFFTFLSWIIELVGVYIISKAIGVEIPFFVILTYLPGVILLSSLPISFLGLGVREGAMVFLFLKYAPSEKILALSILYSFSEHILPVFLGLSLTYLFLNRIVFIKNKSYNEFFRKN